MDRNRTPGSTSRKGEMQSDRTTEDDRHINCTLNGVGHRAIGFVTEWVAAYKFVQANKEKFILYLTLSLGCGVVAFLAVLSARLYVLRRRDKQWDEAKCAEPLKCSLSDLDGVGVTDQFDVAGSMPRHAHTIDVVRYANSEYLVTAPGFLTPNSDIKITAVVTNSSSAGQLEVDLWGTRSGIDQNSTVLASRTYAVGADGIDAELQFRVPNLSPGDFQDFYLDVTGQFGTEQFYNRSSVQLEYKTDVNVVVQTDKPVYRQGSTGLMQGSYDLLAITDEGTWTVTVSAGANSGSTTFEVQDYVLPKFSVTITPDPNDVVTNPTVLYTVCAKYTYGEDVRGTVQIYTSPFNYYYPVHQKPVILRVAQINGCYDYVFNVSLLHTVNYTRPTYPSINVTANVFEHGTGVFETSTELHRRETTRLLLAFDHKDASNDYTIKLNLLYSGKVSIRPSSVKLYVKQLDGTPRPDELVQLCIFVERNTFKWRSWETDNLLACRNYTSDADGLVLFSLPPFSQRVTDVTLQAIAVNFPRIVVENGPTLEKPSEQLSLIPFYSPTASSIRIDRGDGSVFTCQAQFTRPIVMTADANVDYHIFFTLTSGGRILETHNLTKRFTEAELSTDQSDGNEVTNGDPPSGSSQPRVLEPETVRSIGSLEFQSRLPADASPKVQLLVYYVHRDSDGKPIEVVSDSAEFTVQKCLDNNVSLEFDPKTALPGSNVSLSLSAAGNSLCGVGAVDSSVALLDGYTEHNSRGALLNQIKYGNTRTSLVNQSYCSVDGYLYNEPYEKSGDSKIKVRSRRQTLAPTVSFSYDSLSSFEGTAVCLHPQNGLGVSEVANVTGFQPLFVSLTLPAYLQRNEVATVILSAFNYGDDCAAILVGLRSLENLEVIGGPNSTDALLCPNSSTSASFPFDVRATTLEVSRLQARVQTRPDAQAEYPSVKLSKVNSSDTVIQTIDVRPEGFPISETNTFLLCASGDTNSSPDTLGVDLPTPVALVEGSQQVVLVGTASQAQYSFRSFGNSYAPFGSDETPKSVFLTAFAVKALSVAKEYLGARVEADIETSARYVLQHWDASTGCFVENEPGSSPFGPRTDVSADSCWRYTEGFLRSAAIVQITLLSGYSADDQSLKNLVSSGVVKRYVVSDNQIQLIFQTLTVEPTCFSVTESRNLPVANLQDSIVEVYDYYQYRKQTEFCTQCNLSMPLPCRKQGFL
ncbi:hypothetical protein V5799_027979 [Amblyomma americanum]|uniref:Uncharacterized protein n=1 Tax=Amblyomma americanum TaxID=6943 RepID=A0AAQ4DE61_AMBAM